jgi:hypothetical protein
VLIFADELDRGEVALLLVLLALVAALALYGLRRFSRWCDKPGATFRDRFRYWVDCWLRPDLRGRREFGLTTDLPSGTLLLVVAMLPEGRALSPEQRHVMMQALARFRNTYELVEAQQADTQPR